MLPNVVDSASNEIVNEQNINEVISTKPFEKVGTENEAMSEDIYEGGSSPNYLFRKIREKANERQTKAADRMVSRGKKILQPFHVGQCATLRVPDVDRGPTDPEFYTVDCREGVLKSKDTASDLNQIDHQLIKLDEVPSNILSLRTATCKSTGGQGFVKCNCKNSCKVGRCTCRKKKMLCNSRCHPGKSCDNYE